MKMVLQFTVKPMLNGHSNIDKTKVLMANGSLMTVESIAECSPWSILQYFWPALSNNRSWKPILVFFLSGRIKYEISSFVPKMTMTQNRVIAVILL